jgi:hypothetical protein
MKMSKDLNNDSFADMVLQEPSNIWQGVWQSNPFGPSTNWGWLPLSDPSGAKYVAIGDLSGGFFGERDFQDDLIIQDPSLTWQGLYEFSNGFPVTYRGLPSTSGNKIVGSGDINGDGYDDLLLQNPNSKQIILWERIAFTNVSFSGGWDQSNTVVPLPDLFGTDLVAVGDFNGDNYDDLVSQAPDKSWQAIWINNFGTGSWTGIGLSTTYGADIVGSGDYNNDGVDDIILQHPSKIWQGIWFTDLSRPSTQWGWQDLSTTYGADIIA